MTQGTAVAVAVAGAAVAGLTTGATTASADQPSTRYVALGDSYASGAGLSQLKDAECKRSTSSYPSLMADVYKVGSFKDVTCSGATTRSIWNHQGSKPPQAQALSKDTTLVTLTIGGNDIGFAEVITACVLQGLAQPTGAPCKAAHTQGGTDVLAQRVNKLAPRFGDVLTDVKRRSPKARVAVVGYPSLVPDSGAKCRPLAPIADGDVAYLRDTTKRLNSMLASEARKAGAVFVDVYNATKGHDMCQPANKRWIEPPLNPAPGTMAVHPNIMGQLFIAQAVDARLKK
ncbi:SGNH/GDSL hydrolase family protein [Streptomyces sp. NPDC094143]|uniref:SGNH/GDSL hydrolase family protein n=1 Tax=Streptomyces sp. NPDC094143 TaxID=3155310 RepID=UPI00332029F6